MEAEDSEATGVSSSSPARPYYGGPGRVEVVLRHLTELRGLQGGLLSGMWHPKLRKRRPLKLIAPDRVTAACSRYPRIQGAVPMVSARMAAVVESLKR